MTDKFKQLEHGEVEVNMDFNNPAKIDAINKFCQLHGSVSDYMQLIVFGSLLHKNKLMVIPCKRCMLDVAIMLRDCAALVEELAEGK